MAQAVCFLSSDPAERIEFFQTICVTPGRGCGNQTIRNYQLFANELKACGARAEFVDCFNDTVNTALNRRANQLRNVDIQALSDLTRCMPIERTEPSGALPPGLSVQDNGGGGANTANLPPANGSPEARQRDSGSAVQQRDSDTRVNRDLNQARGGDTGEGDSPGAVPGQGNQSIPPESNVDDNDTRRDPEPSEETNSGSEEPNPAEGETSSEEQQNCRGGFLGFGRRCDNEQGGT